MDNVSAGSAKNGRACANTLDRASLAMRSMKKKFPTGLEDSGTNTQLSQVLSHLQIESPANGDPICQACGEAIREGDPVTLYLSRPAGRSSYTVDQCRCSDHNDDLTSLFTLGIRELIVDGRVGQCRDHATQQVWPVLLAPSVRLISSPDTTSGRVVSEHAQTHPNDSGQDRNTGRNSATLTASGDTQSVLSHADRDGSAATSEPRSAGRVNDE